MLWLRIVGLLGLCAIIAIAAPGAWVYTRYQGVVYSTAELVPPAPVAIVFGAAVRPDGEPSWMLAHRVDAAVELYKAGKVQRILMTGDNSSPDYDEVTAMKRYAVEQGVPADRVNLDHAGLRTYDSAYRAKAIFGIEKAVLVTQAYHLPRALYLANSLGIEAVGLKAGQDRYPRQEYYNLREAAANVVTWYEINIIHPLPRFLGEPVDLETQNQ
ncbi:MAG: YdcF family protein [Chloroflexi bacterium]|nr:YdcF family protein [Chloroflexota bacterium]